ncbi:MAG: endonuclease III [Candidatus Campbellbacteria bacterium]|nr:endonuclease III [Candidatus Campbellbacteria bacterium]
MTPQKQKERNARATKLIKGLNKLFPDAKLVLNYKTHWELMVAVQLSAQCTDKKVNQVTKTLFKKYPKFQDYINADRAEFEKDIHSTGFYHNKTKNILAAAKMLDKDFGGKMPRNMKEMLKLPGVARKTANVILGNLFNVVEGIVVDTHMIRFARRFDLTDYKDAVKIERDLMEVIPKKDWFAFTYKVVEYGRSYGNPRGNKDLHQKDPLTKIYPKAKNFWP